MEREREREAEGKPQGDREGWEEVGEEEEEEEEEEPGWARREQGSRRGPLCAAINWTCSICH